VKRCEASKSVWEYFGMYRRGKPGRKGTLRERTMGEDPFSSKNLGKKKEKIDTPDQKLWGTRGVQKAIEKEKVLRRRGAKLWELF